MSTFKTQTGKPINATDGQMDILESVLTGSPSWLSINAYTGYGKSEIVSIASIIKCTLCPGDKIYIIGPTLQRAKILNDYISRHLGDHPFWVSQLSSGSKSEQQLWKERSKFKKTWKNNASIQVLSADIPHKGEAAWGEGTDQGAVIVDEAEGIPLELMQESILRMKRSDNVQLLLIGNPVARGYLYHSMTRPELKDKWKHIHIDCWQGVRENRITTEHIATMASELGGEQSIGFQIKYLSVYPTEYEDSLIPYQKIEAAMNRVRKTAIKEHRFGCDPAHLGADEATIIDVDISNSGEYEGHHLKGWKTTTVPEFIGIIRQRFLERRTRVEVINVDYQGLQGVVDGLMEYPNMKSIVNGIKNGASAEGMNDQKELYKDLFVNTKSRNFWHLRDLFMNDLIIIPHDQKLKEQLMGFKYEHKPNGKIFVIDPPGKSPDRADALCYGCAPALKNKRSMYVPS